jgi:hypothetical protein
VGAAGAAGASGKKARKQKKAADATGSDWELEPVPAPYLGGGLDIEKFSKAARDAAAAKPKAAAAAAASIGAVGTNGKGSKRATDADEEGDSDDDDDEDEDATVGGVTNKQRALIQAAFVGDDVEGEFAADKAKEVEGELPKIDAPVMLPGWGAWNGMQKEPKFIRDKRAAAERERRKAEEGRRDKGKRMVSISEKYDKKASMFHTQKLPHGWSSHEVCVCCRVRERDNVWRVWREWMGSPPRSSLMDIWSAGVRPGAACAAGARLQHGPELP